MFELDYLQKSDSFIAATDEVGRGPLAGPVVGACCLVKGDFKRLNELGVYLNSINVTDSKKLTDKKRERILEILGINIKKNKSWKLEICGFEIDLKVCELNSEKIDEINILQASLLSMKKSFQYIGDKELSGPVLIDGNKAFETFKNTRVHTVVKGDSKSSLIGLASIIAKVYRDKLMEKFSKKYPHYDFEKNAGYPTAKHRDAIKTHGITPIHRKTFGGVKEFVQKSN